MTASKESVQIQSDPGGTAEQKLEVWYCARCKDSRVFEVQMGMSSYFMDPCPYCSDRGWAE